MQINDWTDRLAAKESVRKSGPIRGQPNQKLGDLIAPLGNQLEPKSGQDRDFLNIEKSRSLGFSPRNLRSTIFGSVVVSWRPIAARAKL